MSNLSTREKDAHREAVSMSIADVTKYLQDAFGQKLVAYLTDTKDAKNVGRWSRGEQAPRKDAEDRLRIAYQVFHLLQEKDSSHTVRAWFVGLNPQLGDESPATAIREGRHRDVLIAAKAFLAGA